MGNRISALLRALLLLMLIIITGGMVTSAVFGAAPTVIDGVVTDVHDGDTFSIGKQKIRVFGVDALELNQQCRADAIHQPGPSPCIPCGHASRDALAAIILNKEVQCTKRGQSYDRAVAECTVGEIHIGPWLLSHGWAVSYQQFLTKRDLREYVGAESGAKRASAGIWSTTFVPPADWRNHRARLECERL